ncbi:hypothetical protein BGLA2_1080018 [Burkholderia gladioli]|nr:hypothetical protein BGLA2_1080018 [Burkholderia gladioli]
MTLIRHRFINYIDQVADSPLDTAGTILKKRLRLLRRSLQIASHENQYYSVSRLRHTIICRIHIPNITTISRTRK